MKIVLLSFVCVSVGALAFQESYFDVENALKHFEDFIHKYNKQYHSEEERATRLKIFIKNLININRSNMESDNAVFGINEFADLSSEEFLSMYTGLGGTPNQGYGCSRITDESIPDKNAPDSFDWRSKNAVTSPKNQGSCGSCYAFSAIGHIESQYAIKTGQLVDLSEQQIVDCDSYSYGCQGGLPENSFMALQQLGGSVSEADYPYIGAQNQCNSNAKPVVTLGQCFTYKLRSQDKVKQLLFGQGTLAIGIQAAALQTYHGGVVRDSSCTGAINHAVLLVGYGSDGNVPYWIVKNSWGAGWGEQGYFRLERSQSQQGACGMMNEHMSAVQVQ